MVNDKTYRQFCECIGTANVLINEPMKKHTTFKIGGAAEFLLQPKNITEVAALLRICNEEKIPFHIIGNGSNLLVGDKGIAGAVIQIYKSMQEISVDGMVIKAQAGALLSRLANTAMNNSLGGLEFAAGIPGTVGGAVVMNAGAYGGEIKDVIRQATVITEKGDVIVLKKDELHLGYRTSVIKEKKYIVLETEFELVHCVQEEIQKKMDELKEKRVSKQPLEYPSAGSTFKRPEGHFAGQLIMEAGLRGFQVGGAQVSEKHCGFVINVDKATAADVVALMDEIRARVYEQRGIELESEVQFLGEFDEEMKCVL